MNKKCLGCGSLLQSIDKEKEGYIKEEKILDSNYCERCFKTINYGKVSKIEKKYTLKDILKEKNSTYLYVLDITTISKKTLDILNNLSNVYVVLTKKDLLPKSVKDEKIINYIKERYNVLDIFIISSKKKYNIDNLYNKLIKEGNKNIYVIGYSNAGKSSLINALLSSKGLKGNLTVSKTLNTTLANIKRNIEDITLIDTPGLYNEKSLLQDMDENKIKALTINSEIKPKIYTLRKDFMILLNDFIRIENNTENEAKIIFYINNLIKLEKMRSERRKNVFKEKITVKPNNEDIVIEGIGFIKVVGSCKLDIYIDNKDSISLRDKLV